MADLTPDDLHRAMALPGFRLCDGLPMVTADGHRHFYDPGQPPEAWAGVERWPDWTNPMVAGWLLDLLGETGRAEVAIRHGLSWWDGACWRDAPNLGTACIRAALALGKWPGGVK